MANAKQFEIVRLKRRFEDLLKNESFQDIFSRIVDKIFVYALYKYKKSCFKGKCFNFAGEKIPYFIHHYNATWRNERCIEIALAQWFLDKYVDTKFIELGNVMSYYRDHSHMVIDKYEISPGVRNIDFITLPDNEQYEGLISISTIEHIGWDESPRCYDKIKQSFNKISKVVRNKQKVFVSFPLGYNDYLDDLIKKDKHPFAKCICLVRITKDHTWQEVSVNDALDPVYRYNKRFPAANACFFGIGLKFG